MSDAERDPQVLVSARIADHEKLIHLPSDAARWGWIIALGRAKLRRPAGVFPSRSVLAHDLGRYARFVDDYLRVGLLEDHDGAMVVHDWSKHQERRVDPTAAERQRRHREVTSPVTLRDGDPRGRASALSQSQSSSQSVTVPREGTAVPADDDPLLAAHRWLVDRKLGIPEAGAIGVELAKLTAKVPIDELLATFEDVMDEAERQSVRLIDGRQVVTMARQKLAPLSPLARTSPAPARKGYHAQEDPDVVFGRR